MAQITEINVIGLKELGEFLDDLPKKLQNNIMRGALRAGAKTSKEKAVELCPVGTGSDTAYGNYAGALRDSIRIKTKKKGMRVTASILAGGKWHGVDMYWAYMLEFTGAAPHTITQKGMKALSFGGHLYQNVQHPGFQPNPFMRQALEETAQAFIVDTAAYIKKRLTKEGINAPDVLVEGDE